MAIVCKSAAEIEKMRQSGHIVRQVLDHVRSMVASGVSTMDLERAAEKKIAELGAKPAFKGYYDYYGDAAITVPVSETVKPELRKLLTVTEESLYRGIDQARIGNSVGDVGAAVQEHVEAAGFSVVREFVGHGIGTHLHEEPQVPNYGARGHGAKLREGMVIAIEPMVNYGKPGSRVLEDKWTAVTADGSFSAHFEHCVAVTKDGPVILTR